MTMAIACWLVAAAVSASEAEPLPMESIRNFHTDEVLQPACKPAELRRLKGISDSLVPDRNPSGAWRVAETMLCGANLPPHYLPTRVSREEYGAGEDIGPIRTKVPRGEIETLGGYAYGVGIERRGDDLVYFYNTAGVCSGGFTLRYTRPEWLMVEVGEACD